jgi:hypothetical protein
MPEVLIVNQIFNIYCDESCHLENDSQMVMVLGAVWCPLGKSREISERIREIKAKHQLNPLFEIKWTKVSPAKVDFYLDLVNYFFDESSLHFRALIVPDKTQLRHLEFNQDHNTWYYKMYFDMLKVLLNPEDRYRIYIDIKDTKSKNKVAKLQDVLCNNFYDFSRKIIERIQTVRSHEIEIMQLADLLIGIISYTNRNLTSNYGKLELIERMKKRSGYSLIKTTLLREEKVNLFRWRATTEARNEN